MEYSDPDWCSLPWSPWIPFTADRHEFRVIIPYSQRVRFNTICNRRNPDMLYDLIKSHAALFFMQRQKKTSKDGTFCVYADESDFAVANEVFTFLNGTAGGQETKLTRREADLLAAIQGADQLEYTIQDIQRLTGGSYSGTYKTLKGYDSRGRSYTGLLEKCPAISFTDRTITSTGEDGNTVRRRTEAYAWDREPLPAVERRERLLARSGSRKEKQ